MKHLLTVVLQSGAAAALLRHSRISENLVLAFFGGWIPASQPE
ncbi:MAG: hypothetical protein U1F42_03860 [Candidatus Competibacteraceae bacterium]